MGHLNELVKLNLLVYGGDVAENFKNNSLFFYEKYKKSDSQVQSVSIGNIKSGGFYFLHYLDDSNWMRYSPIFVADYRKFDNQVVLLAVNLNFIPMQIRARIFDKYIKESDFEKNSFLKVDYTGVYKELNSIGFAYSLMEFNLIQVKSAHRIHLDLLPRFLYSQHPKAKYDPNKLIDIWSKKIKDRDQRDAEMMKSVLSDFYDIDKDLSKQYDLLKDHIDRLHKSAKKYGGK